MNFYREAEKEGEANMYSEYSEKEILTKRYSLREKPKPLDEPVTAVKYLLEYESKSKEYMILLLLDTKNNLIKKCLLSIGTVDQAVVFPREIFEKVLKHHAAKFIMGHNHPGGDPTPSRYDIELTNKIARIGNDLGVPLVDHIIVAKYGYRSMQEEGYI